MSENTILTGWHRILFILFIILFAAALPFYYAPEVLSEKGYNSLFSNSLLSQLSYNLASYGVLFLKITINAFVVISTLIIIYAFRDADKHALAVLIIVFLTSPILISNIAFGSSPNDIAIIFLTAVAAAIFFLLPDFRYAAAIPVILAIILSYPFNFSFDNIKKIGFLLPVSMLSLLYLRNGKVENENLFFLLAILAAVFSPPLGMVGFFAASLRPLREILNSPNAVSVTFLIFFLILYLLSDALNQNALVAAAAFAAIIYGVILLYKNELSALYPVIPLFIISLSLSNGMLLLNEEKKITNEHRDAFIIASSLEGNIGIISFPDSFRFYTGIQGVRLTETDLTGSSKLAVKYVLFSSAELYGLLSSQPIAFGFAGFQTDQNSAKVAVFINRNYLMAVPVSGEGKPIADATIYSQNKRTRFVPFTKLAVFSNKKEFSEEGQVVFNMDNLEDSILYGLIKQKELYERNNIKIIPAG